jgi:hypothetical protein
MSNITSDNIKLNILKNIDEKLKSNSGSTIEKTSTYNKHILNIKNSSYNNISNLHDNSFSSSKYIKNNTNLNNDLNTTNYSRAKSIGSKDIKRFNSFVNIEDGLFKLKNEKSLERMNKKLIEKESENIFNSSLNGNYIENFLIIINKINLLFII